ncbi:hypothetical protein MORTIMER_89 [Erwinia phage vB_EamM_Mortimer]|uniref:Uncharacterized protein n=2 Tax=Agricanvirus TaxID=1984776 RepID=A0A173GFG0_9CAUD|nr:hypothetical protein FDH97_gp090 [Erwinia phage vB_EamM_Deimos-Minion]ANH52188.1 hypothetical protein DM_90 [Erwinia phage vB_EamM_Deimos-Minion]AUG86838.1 hypothetical protein MORTIMER_89 [Erwinia phage vB_EamM_Mortimer]
MTLLKIAAGALFLGWIITAGITTIDAYLSPEPTEGKSIHF